MPSYNEAKMVRLIEFKNEYFRKVRRLGEMIDDKRMELNKVVHYIEDATRRYGSNAVAMFDEIRLMPLRERLKVDPKTIVLVIHHEAPGRQESYTANMGINLETWITYLRLCEDIESMKRRIDEMNMGYESTLRLVQDLRSQVIAWGFRDPEEIAA